MGFTIATIDIGEAFQSQGITWVGSVMTCLLVVTYIFILFKHIQAVWRGQIMMEGQDEDVSTPEKNTKAENSDDWADTERGNGVGRPLSTGDMRHRLGGVSHGERRSVEHTGN